MAKNTELKKLELTAAQVRLIKDKSGLTLPQLADEIGIARSGLIRYLKDGVPAGTKGRRGINPGVRRAILTKALELGVINTDEAQSGVFI